MCSRRTVAWPRHVALCISSQEFQATMHFERKLKGFFWRSLAFCANIWTLGGLYTNWPRCAWGKWVFIESCLAICISCQNYNENAFQGILHKTKPRTQKWIWFCTLNWNSLVLGVSCQVSLLVVSLWGVLVQNDPMQNTQGSSSSKISWQYPKIGDFKKWKFSFFCRKY